MHAMGPPYPLYIAFVCNTQICLIFYTVALLPTLLILFVALLCLKQLHAKHRWCCQDEG